MHIWVMGLGNPLLADDGAGWYVCSRLKERLLQVPHGHVLAVHTSQGLFPEQIEAFSQADLAIFIDAGIKEGAKDGFHIEHLLMPSRADVLAIPTCTSTPIHGLSLQDFMRLSAQVYTQLPQNVLICTLAARLFTPMQGLSRAVQEACDQVVERFLMAFWAPTEAEVLKTLFVGPVTSAF
ncbi:MAG: hydrogenase maturation protease [Deltaproteobacteria bacterium]|nr:hydrogenase maturation protease [Deltaproteobacteria bacterium]